MSLFWTLTTFVAAITMAQQTKIKSPLEGGSEIANLIDQRLAAHWDQKGVNPAQRCTDAEYIRRITLDLAGRIPTQAEARQFAADTSSDKRARAVERLVQSPDHTLHFSLVLDKFIQGKHAGDGGFQGYLRSAVKRQKPWDQLFKEILVGPWDEGETKAAQTFLLKRIKSLDDMTRDTTRVFFGVDIMCAKCHDHPLVDDWTQDHYFGMASFFNRTYQDKKKKGKILEKTKGDVQFVTTEGDRKTARPMFLSGKVAGGDSEPEADPGPGRRAQLVTLAIGQREFVSRAIVNQLWNYLIGRGIIHPIDQMHSGNTPSVEGLLEALAADLIDRQYNLRTLVAGITLSGAYQLSSRETAEPLASGDFARATLRPLDQEQLAVSILLATADQRAIGTADSPERQKALNSLVNQSKALRSYLDPRSDNFQSSTTEALFMSNAPEIHKLLNPAGENLVARLLSTTTDEAAIDEAVWAILSRAPEAEEKAALAAFLTDSQSDRSSAIRQLVWALLTSPEFRFNH